MDHDDQWSFANRHIVYVYSVIVRIIMCDIFVNVVWDDRRFRVLHISVHLISWFHSCLSVLVNDTELVFLPRRERSVESA